MSKGDGIVPAVPPTPSLESPRGVAVVSGAGSGLGREIALALARRGHPLVLLGRTLQPLEATRDAAVTEAVLETVDVRDAAGVERVATAVSRRWGAAEVVVPAAGRAAIAPFAETSPETFRELLETNLVGTFLLLRALLPAMRQRGSGHLFALLSTAATRGFPGWSAYCASKWGLRGLVAALREELQGSGVRLTALYPGATDTDIWRDLPGEWDRGRMMPASEVARAVVLALEADRRAAVEEIHLGPAGGAL